jgi:hypothetical protein
MQGTSSEAEAFRMALTEKPDIEDALAALHDAAVAAVDPELLDPCRVRIAMLLGNDPDSFPHSLDEAHRRALPLWPTSPLFSPAQRACLAFTEQFVVDVASLDDATAGAVVAALGGDGCATFVDALLVVEQRQRLRQAWGRLFSAAAS